MDYFPPGEKLKVAFLSRSIGPLELSTYESEEELVAKVFKPEDITCTILGTNDAAQPVHHYMCLRNKDLDTFSLIITSDKVRQIVPARPNAKRIIS